MTSSAVEEDVGTTRRGVIQIVVFWIAGVGIVGATWLAGWGFWGYFGGAFILLVAGLATHGYLTGGGAGVIRCPACGATHSIKGTRAHRYYKCGSCGAWSHGAQTMQLVDDAHVAKQPVFPAPIPLDTPIAWPDECPVCAAPATATVRVKGTSGAGDLASMVLPVSIQRVLEIDVPCCATHNDGVSLEIEADGAVASFRSVLYWRAFMALNQTVDPPGPFIHPPQLDRA